MAWADVIRNAAHDSSCACSVDEVVDAVLHRYAEARQLAEGLGRRALRALASSFSEAGVYVVNPSSRPRGGVVEVVVPGVDRVPGAQLVRDRPASADVFELTGGELNMVLGRI